MNLSILKRWGVERLDPKHTVESVSKKLAEGLEDGTISEITPKQKLYQLIEIAHQDLERAIAELYKEDWNQAVVIKAIRNCRMDLIIAEAIFDDDTKH